MFERFAAYGVLVLGFWLLFQGFERSVPFVGIIGGALVIAGMYLMTGVWRKMFNRFGGSGPIYRRKVKPGEERPDDSNDGDESA
ncbi:MAG: hypothetical protein BZY83_05720 [SAR202 cluster bacterium Casp-Chloro-G2]|nr:MAG: hypothetical protein BZY83_05720 [SAR202 cluster bacterium Casp-Chloro-G2]